MAELWPPSLQQLVDTDTFAEQIGDTLIRSDVDVGPKKARRRFTKSIDTYTVSILIRSATDYNTLKDFYDVTINGGATEFIFNHPVTGVPTNWMFAEPPNFKAIGGFNFQLAMQWELRP